MKNNFIESKLISKYEVQEAFWGDLYTVKIYETHKNIPGFAPDEYDTLICTIWMNYKEDMNRRIEFKQTRLNNPETLKFILKVFTSEFEKDKYTRIDK